MAKRIFYFLLVVFAVMQLFQPDRNTSSENLKSDLANHYNIPDSVETLLNTICYDCHSNNTDYPWFINVQPIGWYMQSKVTKGKQHLNFSEFGNLPKEKALRKLSEIDDVMKTMDKTALAMNYNLAYNDVSILTDKHKEAGNFKTTEEEKIGKTEPVVKHILNYYKIIPEEVESFSLVQEEIVHYNHIKVKTSAAGSATSIEFKRLDELKQKIEKAKNPINVEAKEADLDNLLEKKKINLKEYKEELKKLANFSETGIEYFSHRNEDVEIKKLLNNYYFPSIVSKNDRIKWMKHIVDTPSEVIFLKALEKHLMKKENFFTEFDWWMFSKVDHTLDKQIRIPYIDPANGKRDFLPDFVFWLQKGKDYHILYIDPKGTGRSEYQYKVDGYRDLFEDSVKVKTFKFSGKNFKVHLRLATEDTSVFADKDYYKKYWVEADDFNIKLDK